MPEYDGRLPLPEADYIDLIAQNDDAYIFDLRHVYDPGWKMTKFVIAVTCGDVGAFSVTFCWFSFDARLVWALLLTVTIGFVMAGVTAYRLSGRDKFTAQAWQRCYADPRWQQVIVVHELLKEWMARLYERAVYCRQDRQTKQNAIYEFQILRSYHGLLCQLAKDLEKSIYMCPLGCAQPVDGQTPPDDELVCSVRGLHALIASELEDVLKARAALANDYRLPPRDANGVLVQRD